MLTQANRRPRAGVAEVLLESADSLVVRNIVHDEKPKSDAKRCVGFGLLLQCPVYFGARFRPWQVTELVAVARLKCTISKLRAAQRTQVLCVPGLGRFRVNFQRRCRSERLTFWNVMHLSILPVHMKLVPSSLSHARQTAEIGVKASLLAKPALV